MGGGAPTAAAAAAATVGNPEPWRPSSHAAVDGGERAVMYDRIQGVLEEPIGEGMHVRIPWFQVRPSSGGRRALYVPSRVCACQMWVSQSAFPGSCSSRGHLSAPTILVRHLSAAGWHLLRCEFAPSLSLPAAQSPNIMDIRTRPRSISSITGTKGAHLSLCVPVSRLSPACWCHEKQWGLLDGEVAVWVGGAARGHSCAAELKHARDKQQVLIGARCAACPLRAALQICRW